MDFLIKSREELITFFKKQSVKNMKYILKFVFEYFPEKDRDRLSYFYRGRVDVSYATKPQCINILVELARPAYQQLFYEILTEDLTAKKLYDRLIWYNQPILTQEFIQENRLELPQFKKRRTYDTDRKNLSNRFSFITREVTSYKDEDMLYVGYEIREILKLFYPFPKGYKLLPCKSPQPSHFTYSNEDEILTFIKIIPDMLENNIVIFGKTNEKPLMKSLHILKDATELNEFYTQDGMNLFALDMSIRSLKYYHDKFKFQSSESETLKQLVKYQLENRLDFTISKMFVSHLRGVRFTKDATQHRLFNLARGIISEMPKDDWVSFDNIISHVKIKDIPLDFEYSYKTKEYTIDTDRKTVSVNDNIDELFNKPILKALFFYFGALGLMELMYDKPISFSKSITTKRKPYLSVWDGLKYVRFTELGKYVFGFSKTYTAKNIVIKKAPDLKFDEFKPIISVDKKNIVAIAKLKLFAENFDNNRYILTHNKFFKDCTSLHALRLKIDSFYNKIEKNPPKVFVDFFNNMIKESNLMNQNLKQIVIELKDNKRLLNLFMTNQNLQKLFIKAEGYRIIVLKNDIPKVTKIAKDNGFFVEF
jgi:hypothetical protein